MKFGKKIFKKEKNNNKMKVLSLKNPPNGKKYQMIITLTY